jgi:hypothetical protein
MRGPVPGASDTREERFCIAVRERWLSLAIPQCRFSHESGTTFVNDERRDIVRIGLPGPTQSRRLLRL